MNKSHVIIIGLLISIVVVGAVSIFIIQKKNAAEALQESLAGRALQGTEAVSYTDLYGNPVTLSDFIGTQLVVFSWASWCPSCGSQMRSLETVATERPDITFLAINRAEPAETAVRYLEYNQLTQDGNLKIILDVRDHFYTTVGGYAAPETVIFDPAGAITGHLRGDISAETLRSYLP